MRTIVIFFLTGYAFAGHAQDSLFQIAETEYRQANYSAALKFYSESAKNYQTTDKLEKYATCHLKMAECRLALGDPQKALAITGKTLAYIDEVLPLATQLKATILSVSGNSYLSAGRNDLALEQLQMAESLFAQQSLEAAECYENLGIAYWNNGNKKLGLQYHDKALQIRMKNAADNIVQVADSYNNIGLIYLEDEPKEAIGYFNRSIPIYQQILGVSHPKVAFGYSNLAFASAQLKKYHDAEKYLDQVDEIWEVSFEGDHPNKAFSLNSRGRIFEMKGAYEEALISQQEALKMYLRLYGTKHPEVANTYFLIGSVYQKKNDFPKAADNYQQSIYANLFDQHFETIYDLPQLRDYYNADILLSSLQAKARVFEAIHYEKSLKLRDIYGALRSYLLCDQLISHIRQSRLNESDKLLLGAIATDVYDNGIAIAVYLSNRTFKKKQYQRLAFDLCERSKSAILLEAINETNAKHFAGIPDHEIALEDSLKSEISYLEQKLAQANPKDDRGVLQGKLFKYQTAQRDFILRLENEFPEYYKLKYNQKLTSYVDLQKVLKNGIAVLSYFTGKDRLYAFLITKKSFNIFAFDKSEDFIKNASGLRNAIKYQVESAINSTSRALYEQLIPNIPKNIRSLVVIPDGILGTIPFETLISEVSDEGKPVYLLETYAISYDYSATLLEDRISKTKNTETSGILLTAPVSFQSNEIKMPSLPGSETEIQEIRFLFAGTNHKVQIALNQSASESMIKSDAISEYKYLHFATHGQVNESKPELSRIFLSPDQHEDGSLYSGEIYNLNIRADLVTLSACETGLGKIAKGEGVVGLSRALMYSGAKNLVVSLWQVADASTAQLMIEFYKQHLYHSDNHLFADDLRKAKLSLLYSDNFDAPYYWAPFILVGL